MNNASKIPIYIMTDKTTALYTKVIFKSDCRKINAKVIISTHHKRNKQGDKAITISCDYM